MKKTIYLFFFFICFSVILSNKIFAYTNVQVNISSDKNIIKEGEEIEIVLNIENAKTAAFTSYIYFDNLYLEYLKGPKMSNLDNNRIIYVWYDENGFGDSISGELARFTFKAKKDGVTSLNINGEFYDEDGDVINADFKDFEIRIGENLIEENENNVKIVNENTDNTRNTNLETLAVENILLYPPFDNNITNYDIEVPNDVKDLNILVVPENEKAKVNISGGTELNEGNNSIKVTITAQDGKTQKVFSLNAYKRSKEEQNIYLKEQRENEKKLEEIYDLQNVEIEQNNKTKKEKNFNNILITKRNKIILVFSIFLFIFLVIMWLVIRKFLK